MARRAAKPSATRSAAKRSAAKTTQAPRTSRAAPYTPPPLKGDGWPPFRYPVR